MTTYSLGFILSETMQYVHLRKNYIGSNVLSFIYEFNIVDPLSGVSCDVKGVWIKLDPAHPPIPCQ